MTKFKMKSLEFDQIIKYFVLSLITTFVLSQIFNEVIKQFGIPIGLWGFVIFLLGIIIRNIL